MYLDKMDKNFVYITRERTFRNLIRQRMYGEGESIELGNQKFIKRKRGSLDSGLIDEVTETMERFILNGTKNLKEVKIEKDMFTMNPPLIKFRKPKIKNGIILTQIGEENPITRDEYVRIRGFT